MSEGVVEGAALLVAAAAKRPVAKSLGGELPLIPEEARRNKATELAKRSYRECSGG